MARFGARVHRLLSCGKPFWGVARFVQQAHYMRSTVGQQPISSGSAAVAFCAGLFGLTVWFDCLV